MCGNEEYNFSAHLRINHNLGKKNIGEVFGGEVHTMKFGKYVEPYKKQVGWDEFHIPFKHDESEVWMKIECSKCETPIKNEIIGYGVMGGIKPGIKIQSKIKTVMK